MDTKVNKATKIAASLLAKAYIAGRSGNEQRAAAYMMAACRTDDLDTIMAGVASAMGIEEDDYDDDDMDAGCEGEDCFAGDEDDYDDMEASDEDDMEVDMSEVDFDEDDDDVEADFEEEDIVTKVSSPDKIAVPASCYRLARARY